MPRDAEIVVVGAGVAGAATARVLALAGRDVVLVEQFAIGHDRGSSHGAARIFRLSYPDERYVRLAQAALDGWHDLEAERGEQLLLRNGSLDLGAFTARNARALARCGVTYELLDGLRAAGRWPLHLDSAEPVLFQPDGGVVLADRALRAFVDGAREAGATVLERTRVTGLSVDRRTVRVATDADELCAQAVVVTAGAWTQRLLAPVGIELPVVPTRETIVYVRLACADTLPPIIDEVSPGSASAYGIPRTGQFTYAVPSPGLGLKIGLHHAGPLADPDEAGTPSDGVVRWAAEWAHRRLPHETCPVAGAETCLYTSTADERFVLERHGRIVVGSACSGHGFKFAPAVGRTLAALAREALGW